MDFKQWFESALGCGHYGCAYDVGGGTVVKVTKSKSEADTASWLVDHPHPNIAKYLSVTDRGGSWAIVMEKLDTDFPHAKTLERLRIRAEKAGNAGPRQIADHF